MKTLLTIALLILTLTLSAQQVHVIINDIEGVIETSYDRKSNTVATIFIPATYNIPMAVTENQLVDFIKFLERKWSVKFRFIEDEENTRFQAEGLTFRLVVYIQKEEDNYKIGYFNIQNLK